MDVSEGSLFVNIGEILASFQVVGTLPCTKEKLNRSLKGFDKGFDSCFRSLLLIPSGPAAFSTESEFRVSSTSFGCVRIDSSACLFLEVNGGGGWGKFSFHQEMSA